ncbi:hypothetical protein Dimus_020786 [Dionaea muscipula]
MTGCSWFCLNRFVSVLHLLWMVRLRCLRQVVADGDPACLSADASGGIQMKKFEGDMMELWVLMKFQWWILLVSSCALAVTCDKPTVGVPFADSVFRLPGGSVHRAATLPGGSVHRAASLLDGSVGGGPVSEEGRVLPVAREALRPQLTDWLRQPSSAPVEPASVVAGGGGPDGYSRGRSYVHVVQENFAVVDDSCSSVRRRILGRGSPSPTTPYHRRDRRHRHSTSPSPESVPDWAEFSKPVRCRLFGGGEASEATGLGVGGRNQPDPKDGRSISSSSLRVESDRGGYRHAEASNSPGSSTLSPTAAAIYRKISDVARGVDLVNSSSSSSSSEPPWIAVSRCGRR